MLNKPSLLFNVVMYEISWDKSPIIAFVILLFLG